jgi:hypothetical protein
VNVLEKRVSRDFVTLTANEGGRRTFVERHRSCGRSLRDAFPRRPATHAGLSHRDCCPSPILFTAVLSSRGSGLNDRRTRASAAWPDPMRRRTRHWPGGAHRVVKVPRRFSACLGLLPLAGLRARDVRTGRCGQHVGLPHRLISPRDPSEVPYPLMGFRRPSSADGPIRIGLHPHARSGRSGPNCPPLNGSGVAVPSAYCRG